MDSVVVGKPFIVVVFFFFFKLESNFSAATEVKNIATEVKVDLWAEHLVFVKWSKIQALFSPRHCKDKAGGKS